MQISPRWILFGLAAGLSSCGAVVPHTFHTPWVAARGESEVSLNTGLHGSGAQVAHAFTDRVTLLGSYQQRVRSSRGVWAYSGEAGAGRTWRVGRHGAWSLYGGLGYGAGQSGSTPCVDICGDRITDRVRYGYAYVQPTYRWRPYSGFGLSAGVKVIALNFRRYDTTRDPSYGSFGPVDSTNTSPGITVESRPGYLGWGIQPGFGLYWGLGRHFRLTYSTSVLIPTARSFPSATPLAVGLGLQYYFGGRPAGE